LATQIAVILRLVIREEMPANQRDMVTFLLGRILINNSQSLEKMIQGSGRSLGDGALRCD